MTIYGWDLSHYDGPDSRAAIGEGFSFFTHKAGGDRDDAEYGTWWDLMRGYRDRVLLGAYWVLYPGDPVGRADTFLARLDSQSPGWRDGPFILQADCEIWGGDTSTRPGRADIRAFCDRLRARMPKLRPIVYAPKWAYQDSLTGLGYPLWASSYVPGEGYASDLYPGDASPRWGAYSGQVPEILQFSSSAIIAGQTTCDANAYRGTLAELTALLAPGWETDLVTTQAEFNALMTNWAQSADGVNLGVRGLYEALALIADVAGGRDGTAKDPTPTGRQLKNNWARANTLVLAAQNAALTQIATAVQTGSAEDSARDAATAAAITTAVAELRSIRTALESAGGSPDVAPVLERLDAIGDLIATAGQEAGRQAAATVLERIAEAHEAGAGALRQTS